MLAAAAIALVGAGSVVWRSGLVGDTTLAQKLAIAQTRRSEGDVIAAISTLKSAVQQAPNDATARRTLGEVYVQAMDGASAEKELRRAVELGTPAGEVEAAMLRAILLQQEYERVAVRAGIDEVPLSQVPEDRRAEVLALHGRALFALGKVEEAQARYEQALAITPGNPDAELGLALLDSSKSNVAAARARLEALVEKHEQFAEAWILLGDIDAFEDRLDGAERNYTRAIEVRAGNPEYLKRAQSRMLTQQYAEALADLGVLRERQWTPPEVDYATAMIALLQGDPVRALNVARKLSAQHPDFVPAKFLSGLAAYQQGQLEQAQNYLEEYVAQAPATRAAALLLGYLQLRRGDAARAQEVLGRALEMNPQDAQLRDMLATAMLARGEFDAAIASFEQNALEQAESELAKLRLGIGLAAAGRGEEAAAALRSAAKQNPASPAAAQLLFHQLIQNGDVDGAMEIAEQVRVEQPTDPIGYDLAGLALIARKMPAEARESFRHALDLAPNDLIALRSLAVLAAADGDPDGAREYYQRALDHHPAHLETLLALAALEENGGRTDETARLLEQALHYHPSAVPVSIALAHYQWQAGQLEAAIGTLETALKNTPANVRLLNELGGVYMAAGQVNRGLEYIERIVQLAPDSAETHFLLAQASVVGGDESTAMRELERTLELDPNHQLGSLAKARLNLSRGKLKEASEALAVLGERHADHPDVMDLAADIASAQGRADEAVDLYDKVFRAYPSALRAVRLSEAQGRAGQRDKMVTTLEAWVQSHPQDVVALGALAETYQALSRSSEAVASYERLLQLEPNDVTALNNLAWELMTKDPRKGLEYANAARKQSGDHPAVLDTYAMLLLETGDTAQAIDILGQIAEQSPDVPLFRYHLATALAMGGQTDGALELLRALLQEGAAPFAEQAEAKALLAKLEADR